MVKNVQWPDGVNEVECPSTPASPFGPPYHDFFRFNGRNWTLFAQRLCPGEPLKIRATLSYPPDDDDLSWQVLHHPDTRNSLREFRLPDPVQEMILLWCEIAPSGGLSLRSFIYTLETPMRFRS